MQFAGMPPMQAGGALQPGVSPQQMAGAMGAAAMPSYASRPPSQFTQPPGAWPPQ